MLERFGDKACYTYNSAGIRTEKCIKNKATKYVVSGSTILSETTDGVSIIYYHGADGVVGFNRGADYYYRKNMQGDIIAIVNASGGIVAKYVYDAWGNHKVYNASGTVIYDSQNSASTYANEIGYINPFRYRSYYFDNETGLYYLQSRYYDPQVGRFINADSINYIDAKNFSGLNLYAYCYNNPVIFLDDRGCFPRWAGWLIIGLVAMAFTAVAAFAITSAVISISTMGTAAIGTSVASGIGMGAVTSMVISVEQQGGFAKADLLKVAGAMFLGAVTGAIAGAFGHVATGFGQAIGSSIGSNIAKVIGRSIVSSTTSMLLTTTSSAIVGAVAGTASNILLNRAFDGLDGEHETLGETITGTVQSDVFSWLYALLNWLFE